MATKPCLVFFGNERLATGVTTEAPVLRGLIAAGYDIAAVVSNYRPAASSRRARPLEIEHVAKEHEIPLLLPARPADILEQLRSYEAPAAVLVAYGRIVPPAMLELFPAGIINIHPSLLPAGRGSTPIETAILGGAAQTGVSLMKLARAMDAGPVYAQVTHQLSGSESKQKLATTLLERGRNLLLEHLPAIIDGSLAPSPQDETKATYTSLIQKSDGRIDLSKSAAQIEREIRAYLGWPGSRTTVEGSDVIITAAHVEAPGEVALLAVDTADGRLAIDQLKPAGKREMSAADFLAGRRSRSS